MLVVPYKTAGVGNQVRCFHSLEDRSVISFLLAETVCHYLHKPLCNCCISRTIAIMAVVDGGNVTSLAMLIHVDSAYA